MWENKKGDIIKRILIKTHIITLFLNLEHTFFILLMIHSLLCQIRSHLFLGARFIVRPTPITHPNLSILMWSFIFPKWIPFPFPRWWLVVVVKSTQGPAETKGDIVLFFERRFSFRREISTYMGVNLISLLLINLNSGSLKKIDISGLKDKLTFWLADRPDTKRTIITIKIKQILVFNFSSFRTSMLLEVLLLLCMRDMTWSWTDKCSAALSVAPWGFLYCYFLMTALWGRNHIWSCICLTVPGIPWRLLSFQVPQEMCCMKVARIWKNPDSLYWQCFGYFLRIFKF